MSQSHPQEDADDESNWIPLPDTSTADTNPEDTAKESNCSSISLSYLAQLSSDVYNEEDDDDKNDQTTSPFSEIVEVGLDRFSLHEYSCRASQKPILIIVIRGTASPLQHVMNALPHASAGLAIVERAFTAKNTTTNTIMAANNLRRSLQSNNERTAKDAYEEGNYQGWKEPSKNIYEEVLHRLSLMGRSSSITPFDIEDTPEDSTSDATNTAQKAIPIDLHQTYARIIFCGHSRGGLLAYYAATCCRDGTSALHPPYIGELAVIGFGMPPPMSPPSTTTEKTVCTKSVLSVWHVHDPVANGSVLKVPSHWNPLQQMVLGNSPQEQQERLEKQQQAEVARRKQQLARASSRVGLWGAIGNLAATAVEAVGDKAGTYKKDIRDHHLIGGYQTSIDACRGELANVSGNNGSFRVELLPQKENNQQQWEVIFR